MRFRSVAFACLCLSLAAAAPARAEISQKDRAAILKAVCAKGQIRKGQCAKAARYPGGKACNIELTGEGGEGRFLSSDQPLLFAVYRSECESHASNWGGALIFEKRDGKLAFGGYQQGLAGSGCLTLPKPDGSSDRLICMTGWMGQGYQSEMLGEVVFARDQAGKITAEFKELLAAGNSEGALGVNSVQCGKPDWYFTLGNPKRGPSPETILLTIAYADKAQIEQLCAKPGRNAALGMRPPNDDEAYIPKQEEKSGRFVYDLSTGTVSPAPK
jgi:hypothetical protein